MAKCEKSIKGDTIRSYHIFCQGILQIEKNRMVRKYQSPRVCVCVCVCVQEAIYIGLNCDLHESTELLAICLILKFPPCPS